MHRGILCTRYEALARANLKLIDDKLIELQTTTAQTQKARNEMGPGMTALSALTGIRGFSRGVGPVGAGPLAERLVGTSALNPALQAGGYTALESAVAGDDPDRGVPRRSG